MNCPVCDTAVVADASFCHACGARLGSATNPHPLAGTTETDRLPAWLKQDHESSTAPDRRVNAQPERPPSARPIPDGGLSRSMPAWLAPHAAHQDAAKAEQPAPAPPSAEPPDTTDAPTDNLSSTIDVAGFLATDDLPVWIRRIADPTTIEVTEEPAPEPVVRVEPPSARRPTSPAEMPSPPPPVDSAPPDERVRPDLPRVAPTTLPESPVRQTRISWHLLFFVAIVIVVAIAGYAVYLTSVS